MGLSSSKIEKNPCNYEQVGQVTNLSAVFNEFMEEYTEKQPETDVGPPWVISFNQLSAAYYSYLYDVKKYKNPLFGPFSLIMYEQLLAYTHQPDNTVIKIFGFITGERWCKDFGNIMVSGVRLSKVPVPIIHSFEHSIALKSNDSAASTTEISLD